MSQLLKIFIWVFSLLPLPIVHLIGVILAWGFILVPNKRRSTIKTNLAICFPNLSSNQRSRLLRNNLLETGKGIIETGVLWCWSKKRVLKLIKKVEGKELLDQAMSSGKGCILAAPHLGVWEILGVYASPQYPMTIMYRPPPLAGMDSLIRRARERVGAKLVPTDRAGVKSLYAALGKGELIGVLPDQDPGPGGGVFAPYFGTQANTMTLLSRLAAKTGATVVFGYVERLKFGRGYVIHFTKGSEEINQKDTLTSCTAVNAGVEKCVRVLPDQYLWCYKRFRCRPEGEAHFYSR
ncbi:MAG: lysophospholipid acyltransferase family protein [Acidiferrobacterales bacterium]